MKEEDNVIENLVLYKSKPLLFLTLFVVILITVIYTSIDMLQRDTLAGLSLWFVIWISIIVAIGVRLIFRYSFYRDFYVRTDIYFGIFKSKEKRMAYDSIKCLEIRKLGYPREFPTIIVHNSEKQIEGRWSTRRSVEFNFRKPELLIPLLTYLKEHTEVKIKINIDSSYRKQYKLLKPFDNYSKRKYFEKNEN